MFWDWIASLSQTILGTVVDVVPIIVILVFFQLVVLRQHIPHLRRVLIGFGYVVVGLALFLVGLEKALFPVGEVMARQLTDPAFLGNAEDVLAGRADWRAYGWVYAFALAIGFSTTIAEPALIAVALKAREVSGGNVSAHGLRVAVALGVAVSIAVGVFRIVTGTPL